MVTGPRTPALALMLFAGCGPQVSHTSGGAGDGGNADDTGGVESGEAGSSGHSAVCREYADDPPPGILTVEIHNVGPTALFFNEPCLADEFMTITDATGASSVGRSCVGTCEQQSRDGCYACDEGCASAHYVAVAPGEVLEVGWTGLVFEPQFPPDECFVEEPCGRDCLVARLPDTEITVRVEAVSATDCPMGNCVGYVERIPPTLFAGATWQPGSEGPIVVEIGA